MEENKKTSWEELSNRDKKAITKRMNKWFDMSEEQIVDFYNDRVDNYYDEDDVETTTEETTSTEKEDVIEESASKQVEQQQVQEPTIALTKRIDELESLIKAQDEVIKASQGKIDKAYEILEAQGKDTESFGAKLFGGETKQVQENESQGYGKSLFERK